MELPFAILLNCGKLSLEFLQIHLLSCQRLLISRVPRGSELLPLSKSLLTVSLCLRKLLKTISLRRVMACFCFSQPSFGGDMLCSHSLLLCLPLLTHALLCSLHLSSHGGPNISCPNFCLCQIVLSSLCLLLLPCQMHLLASNHLFALLLCLQLSSLRCNLDFGSLALCSVCLRIQLCNLAFLPIFTGAKTWVNLLHCRKNTTVLIRCSQFSLPQNDLHGHGCMVLDVTCQLFGLCLE
mmetsp:Transcript_54266/g.108074  ORF Transcript_54266/g.108074 Transcript_54266/m.108074 type:complete len:238 (-) Transcript_54266:126-839(-)